MKAMIEERERKAASPAGPAPTMSTMVLPERIIDTDNVYGGMSVTALAMKAPLARDVTQRSSN